MGGLSGWRVLDLDLLEVFELGAELQDLGAEGVDGVDFGVFRAHVLIINFYLYVYIGGNK